MLKIEKEICCGCSACSQICPKNCIAMQVDEKGFLYPHADEKLCINCGFCEKVCPVLNLKENNEEKVSYAAYNKDEYIRKSGSSGGIFGALADYVIRQGGVVFGAGFSDDFKSARHIAVENGEDLEKLYGSKYLQSEIGDSYKLVKEYLNQDRFVLFSGTSCQINGLKLFLHKEYEKLITVDVICHGTPSPKVWADYVRSKEEASNQTKVINAQFRNKRFGWHNFVLLLSLSDGTEYCKVQSDDDYMSGFLQNLFLRDSCYHCRCKGKHMMSDITLGDFWGIESVLPNVNVDNGISAVISNTEKGREVFNLIKDNLQVFDVEYSDILKGNSLLEYSVNKLGNSERFWKRYKSKGLDAAFKKCLHPSFSQRGFRFVKRVCKGCYHFISGGPYL